MQIFKNKFFLSFLFFFLFFPNYTYADLALLNGNVYFSNSQIVLEENVRIFVKITNYSLDHDLRGVIKIFDETEGIFFGDYEQVYVLRNSTSTIFADFSPNIPGEHKVAVRIVPLDEELDDPSNNKIIVSFLIDQDSDGDGIGNSEDLDDDNDGVPDVDDAFPTNAKEYADSDGDGIGNNADYDDDNDGFIDSEDAFPYDSGENTDTDNDSIGDNADLDDDNDGLSDTDEIIKGTDPKLSDTDNDGVNDNEDDFPLDPSKTKDTDQDGIDDSIDYDDDNDGVPDGQDQLPFNPHEHIDTDNDGIGDNADFDDDNDGLSDADEIIKGTDPKHPDTDHDGVNDNEDAFPLDPLESKDSDNDGLGDNADENDNNQGPVIIVQNTPQKNIYRGDSILFDASSSFDPDGLKVNTFWEFDEAEGVFPSPIVERTFQRLGNQIITLRVLDAEGESRIITYEICVYPNQWDILLLIILILILLGMMIYRKFYKKKKVIKKR